MIIHLCWFSYWRDEVGHEDLQLNSQLTPAWYDLYLLSDSTILTSTPLDSLVFIAT